MAEAQPFAGTTKHKPIKRMTRSEVRKAQAGVNLYVRENGKVYRNSGRAWTKVTKPRDNVARKPYKAKK